MNQIPNIEEEKGIKEILNDNRKETLFDSDEANETADEAINNFIIAVLPELTEHLHQQLQKAREEEGEKWRGNDAWSYLGNELHLYTRACIDKVKITRNGEVFEFTLPKTDIHSELDQDKK